MSSFLPALLAPLALAALGARPNVGASALPTRAEAQVEEQEEVELGAHAPRISRAIAVVGHLGLDAPLGIVGASVAWLPVRWASIDLGGGLDRKGPQLGLMPRIHAWPRPDLGIGIGFGLSAGAWSHANRDWLVSGVCYPCEVEVTRRWKRAFFANREASIEPRPSRDSTLGVQAGVGRVLNPDDGTCEPHGLPCRSLDGLLRGYVSVSLGHLFWL